MHTKSRLEGFLITGLIVVNVCVLVVVFSFPPISLPDEYQYSADKTKNVQNKLLNSSTDRIIMAELQKGINEIQMRLEDQSRWFQYKFLFVGGLLAAFFGLFPYAHLKTSFANGKGWQNSGELLIDTLKSAPVSVGLAAICSLSLMIDLHIRGNAIVVNQIGLWISSHIEPLYFDTNVFPARSFVPWETFLRYGGAMHTDVVNSITFFWPIHILTIICFLLYMLSTRVPKRDAIKEVDILAFSMVHFCLIVLAWTGHYIPPIFQVKIPLLSIQQGVLAAIPYVVLSLVLTIINGISTFSLSPPLRHRNLIS